MKKTILLSTLALSALFLTYCAQNTPRTDEKTDAPATATTEADEVKRGAYLVETMGCNDCHSPKIMTAQGPVPDPKRLLSGHPADETLPPVADKNILKGYALFSMGQTAAIGPWGTSFAANLTPDESGTGNWTLEQFGRALRQGKSKGMENGRMLLPPMPWQNAIHLTDADLKALWAYLRSIPPVRNVVPAPIPPAG
jgi:ABC-type Fe3+-hydroxamate transport system substrate-binding protein